MRSLFLKIRVITILRGTYKLRDLGIDSIKNLEFPTTHESVVGCDIAKNF